MLKSPSYLQWILEVRSGKEHAYFTSFVRHFNFTDKDSATTAYQSLIDSTTQKTAKLAGGIIQDAGLIQTKRSLDQYFESTTPSKSPADAMSENRIENRTTQLSYPNDQGSSSRDPATKTTTSISQHTQSSSTPFIPHTLHDDYDDVDDPSSSHEEDDESNNESESGDEEDSDKEDLRLISVTSPFDDLVAILFQIYNHRVPRVTPITPPLSGTLKELHEYAFLNLSKWGEISDIKKKSTLLALSGILNTMDNEMQDLTDYTATKEACFEEDFTSPSAELKTIIDEFIDAMGGERSLWKLKTFCREQQLEATKSRHEGSNRARVINTVEYLCSLIENEKWGESLSETEFVAIWEHIFSQLLLTTIATRTGELGLAESRSDRRRSEWLSTLNKYNIKSRKVDLLFQSKIKNFKGKECRNNIAVFEAKSAIASENMLWIQMRKALRLNKSVMCSLRQLDVIIPPLLLDLHGQRGYIYTLKKFDGYYGAGSVNNQCIRLPTTENEMFKFIKDGGLVALYKIKERLLKIDEAVRDAFWEYEERHHQHRMSTTTSAKRAATDIPTIWTPTKKRNDNKKKKLTAFQLDYIDNPHMTFL
ncbi:hypothetical protein BGZ49_006769 [Haplosporangium sp. Z 27]|nr:hypothetical protein BGZ49_006769 [Haplosporangium sp. Z 27]